MAKNYSDAHDMSAVGLLRSAARLVERALIKLDMTETPCPHCETGLFYNRDQARVYEQLSDTPTKLRAAADRIYESVVNGKPRASSRGFAEAVAQARLVAHVGNADDTDGNK